MRRLLHNVASPVLKALLAGSLVLCLTACDQHKAEREQAQNQLSQLHTEHSHLLTQLEQAQADLSQTERAWTEQQAQRALIETEQAQRKGRLSEYLGEHKAAALALAASGAGAITALDDETRQSMNRELGQGAADMAVLAGVLGAGYCMFNMDECASVGSYLASYSMQNKASVESLQQVQTLMQQLEQTHGTRQEAVRDLSQRVDASRTAMDEIETRIAQLQCKGPLC